jgi:RNA polymerase sigma factor (sigma-70 family)
MTTESLFPLLVHVRHIAGTAGLQRLSDRELLERFLTGEDQAAFATLVQRNGKLVLAACRQVLADPADIEDVFQATFLTLLHKATTIPWQPSLGSWLFATAHRIALRARNSDRRRKLRESRASARERSETSPPDLSWMEAESVLHEELDRLPERYRLPLLLCYLEGKSRDEAAEQLGVSSGALKWRLERGREKLRQRLVGRGITLSVGLLGAVVNSSRASSVPPRLVQATVTATTAGPGARVAALTTGVPTTMFANKGFATSLLLCLGMLAGIASYWLSTPLNTSPVAAEEGKPKPQARPAQEEGDRLPIHARVLDPDGKPIHGAKLFLRGRPLGESDRDGSFHVTLSRSKLDEGSPGRDTWVWAQLLATAKGYAPDWRELRQRDREGNLTLNLVKDDLPITGRIVDLEGRPVAGATVRINRVNATADEDLSVFLKVWRDDPLAAMFSTPSLSMPVASPKKGVKRSESPQWRRLWPDQCRKLFPPVTTDRDGKFRLSGVGRERLVELIIQGPEIEEAEVRVAVRQGLDIKALSKRNKARVPANVIVAGQGWPSPALYGATFEHVAGPTKPVTGVVRDQSTGKPLAGVRITGSSTFGRGGRYYSDIETSTDEKGRYRLVGLPKGIGKDVQQVQPAYSILAEPAKDAIYLPARKELRDSKGFVHYFPLLSNPNLRFDPELRQVLGRRHSVVEEGTFKLVALPGPGVILAYTEYGSYRLALAPEDEKKWDGDRDLQSRLQAAHVFQMVAPKEGAKPLQVDLQLVPMPKD